MHKKPIKLHGYFRSSAAYRVRIALNVKALDYEPVFINLKLGEQYTDEWLSHNPQGLVPMLETPEGYQLTQSMAILEWLEENYPGPALLPSDYNARAKVRSMANQIACDIHPLNNLRILKYLTNVFQVTEESKMQWYRHWIDVGFTAFEKQLTGDNFCFGEQISMADICLIPQVYNAMRFNVDMSVYPHINKVYNHCMSLSPFFKASPEQQPDVEL